MEAKREYEEAIRGDVRSARQTSEVRSTKSDVQRDFDVKPVRRPVSELRVFIFGGVPFL